MVIDKIALTLAIIGALNWGGQRVQRVRMGRIADFEISA